MLHFPYLRTLSSFQNTLGKKPVEQHPLLERENDIQMPLCQNWFYFQQGIGSLIRSIDLSRPPQLHLAVVYIVEITRTSKRRGQGQAQGDFGAIKSTWTWHLCWRKSVLCSATPWGKVLEALLKGKQIMSSTQKKPYILISTNTTWAKSLNCEKPLSMIETTLCPKHWWDLPLHKKH